MIYTVEMWTPTAAWLTLSITERTAYIQNVAAATKSLTDQGVEMLTWSLNEQGVSHASTYQYFAIWRFPTEALAEQYTKELVQMRLKSQEIIAEAEAAATKTRNQQVLVAQQEAQVKVDAARAEIAKEKEQATQALEAQIGQLSQQVIGKLLA